MARSYSSREGGQFRGLTRVDLQKDGDIDKILSAVERDGASATDDIQKHLDDLNADYNLIEKNTPAAKAANESLKKAEGILGDVDDLIDNIVQQDDADEKEFLTGQLTDKLESLKSVLDVASENVSAGLKEEGRRQRGEEPAEKTVRQPESPTIAGQTKTEKGVFNTKYYAWFADPSHGWLRVPAVDVEKSGYKPTPYSPKRGDSYYLEEDQDAGEFLKAAGLLQMAKDKKIEFPENLVKDEFKFPRTDFGLGKKNK